MPEAAAPPKKSGLKHIPVGHDIFYADFATDIFGFFYLDKYTTDDGQEVPASTLNRQMADFFERCSGAWLATRHRLRKRVKIAAIVPRKGRKTTIFTQSGPPYLLFQDPELSIVIDAEQKQRANWLLASIKNIVGGKSSKGKFREFFPAGWSAKDREWKEDSIVINLRQMVQRKEPSIVTSSVEIGYTGGAPDVIIIDDPMSPETHTETWMKQVINHYEGYGPVLVPNGLFVLCMTRYDDEDLAGHIERSEGWHVCDGPEAEECIRRGKCSKRTEEHPEPWHVFFRQALDDQDRSIDEAVWPTEFLLSERKKNPAFFAAQYMNDPWQNPDASFQKEDFSYAAKAPADIVKVLSSDIAWKTASEGTERGGDWNVFVLGCHHRATGNVYVTDIRRGRWTMGEWGDELVRVLRESRRDRIPISRLTYEELKGGAAGALETAVRAACQRWSELAPALVKAARSQGANAKIERIKSIAQYFQNHQVFFVRPCGSTQYEHDCPRCTNFQILRSELLKLGTTIWDDAADAMADQFLPDIYHPAAVFSADAAPPLPLRPYDDDLKSDYGKPSVPISNPDDERLLNVVMEDLGRINDLQFYPRPT